MGAPERLLESRAFAVLVDGDELIARPALASLFGPGDDATLVIGVDDARTDAMMSGLQEALDAAGLDGDALPDLLVLPTPAGTVDPRAAPELAAILSEDAAPSALEGLPVIGLGFEFGARAGHFLQVKAWDARAAGRVDLAHDDGHTARFEGRRVFPYKFLLLHYPVRSQAHGERKVFGERRARWNAGERGRGWHHQYDDLAPDHRFVRDAAELAVFDEDFARRSLVERLSGIGIVRP